MRFGRRRKAWVAFGPCIFLSASLLVRPAAGEPSAAELAAAREIFQEARRAEDAGNWPAALEKVRAVASVKVTAQVRFHLGLCEEKVGQLVEALNDFERAAAEAAEQHVAAVAAEAPEHAAQVRARLPRLRFAFSTPPSDVTATIDGAPIAASVLTHPFPVNPGAHRVEAKTVAGAVFREEVTLAEREQRVLNVLFTAPPERPAPSAEPAPAPLATADAPAGSALAGGGDPAAAAPPRPSPSAPPESGAPERDPGAESRVRPPTLAWAGVGAGGAMLVGALAAALVRSSALSTIEDRCPTHQQCPPDLRADQDRARTAGAVGLALGAVGGAAILGGLTVVLLTRSADHPQGAQGTIAPWMTPYAGGASATLSW